MASPSSSSGRKKVKLGTSDVSLMASSPSSSVIKKVVLRTSDGEQVEVEEAVAKQCRTLNSIMEDGSIFGVIPVPNVDAKTLTKIMEYLKIHVDDDEYHRQDKRPTNEEMEKLDKEFLKVELDFLINILSAASYLDINKLIDLVSQAIADRIKDKSVEEVREIFGIENDFTPEEERQARNDNMWAFE